MAAAAVITPAGIAIPAAVLATQAMWSGVAFATSATRQYDATLTSPCTKQYANTWEHATAAKLYGASTKFKPPTWHVWKASSHFINQELWVYTDWSKASNPLSHDTHKTWVEAGLHDGIFSSSHGLSFQYLGGFWADSRGGTGGYHNHSLTQIWAPHASSTYQFSILRHSATYSNYNVSARIYSKNLTITHSQKGESTHDPHTESGQWTNAGFEDLCYPHSQQYVKSTQQIITLDVGGSWKTASHYGLFPVSLGITLHWSGSNKGHKFSVSIPT